MAESGEFEPWESRGAALKLARLRVYDLLRLTTDSSVRATISRRCVPPKSSQSPHSEKAAGGVILVQACIDCQSRGNRYPRRARRVGARRGVGQRLRSG